MVCFDYGVTTVGHLRAVTERSERGKVEVKSLAVDGRIVRTTSRFWRSFFVRFGISDNVFRYFEPHEVFHRIAERAKNDHFRFCVEQSDHGGEKILAISNPDRPVIHHDEIRDLAERHGSDDLSYAEGIVTTRHRPRSGESTFRIGGDDFQHRYILETPVDGLGSPRIYLSFLRLICENGAVGYTRAFRSEISQGANLGRCIDRALDSFDNSDGYAALRQRFDAAQSSWASVRECVELARMLQKVYDGQQLRRTGVMSDLWSVTGNLNQIYGLANLDAVGTKRQRVLPAKCKVYDLLNFASEVATHHAQTTGAQRIQAHIGSLISDEYDLEGSADAVTDFADLFMDTPEGPSPSLN